MMMQDALVYLAAAVLCVPLAKRLGLGSILGYLLAGVAIGPWGLRLVEDVESILHLSEFGVVLMLFVIGLELEAQRLWEMRSAVFGGGALQLALSGAALALGGLALGIPLQTAIVAGLALALSSTAIAMQTMGERRGRRCSSITSWRLHPCPRRIGRDSSCSIARSGPPMRSRC